jgi:AcrR family transcriptional regulator
MTTSPESTSRIRRKRQARRDRIVEAAVEAIAECGPAEFSLNQLARELDYTPGALYWYFPSKESLVAEVQRVVLKRLGERLAEQREVWKSAPSVTGESVGVRSLYSLLRQALFYLRLEQASRVEARIMAFSLDPRIWLDEAQSKELAPVLAEIVRESGAGFLEAMQVGVLDAASPAERCLQYWANNQGAVQLTKLARFNPGLFRPERLGMDGAKALLRGWGAPADELSIAWEHLVRDMSLA